MIRRSEIEGKRTYMYAYLRYRNSGSDEIWNIPVSSTLNLDLGSDESWNIPVPVSSTINLDLWSPVLYVYKVRSPGIKILC